MTDNDRSKRFEATRKHHRLESAEDYTELILDLIEETGEARTGKVAEQLGVSHVTASKTIKRLKSQGYLLTDRGMPITLTRKGKELALFSRERHQMLLELFDFLGVPESTAEIDVEGAEHHISKVTMKKIAEFLERQK